MLSDSSLEQAGPFLSARECPVLWVFILADVSRCQVSSSFFYHPHTLSRLSNSHLLSFTLDSFQAAHLQKMVKKGILSLLVFDSGYTRVLQEI